ncbi:MAG: SapC family protein [Alphaproteobacteria bacterium]|nr:SapC family protein [Alphaproteobacteria bacterium]
MPESPASASSKPQALPLFYKLIEVLTLQRHARLAVKAQGTYAFAAAAHSVPVNALECSLASHSYPIVFSGDETGPPVAVFGLESGENLFVDKAGHWERGQYIPAYVRRYPFIALAPEDSTDYALYVDVASDLFEPGGARPLFENGQPSNLTKKALEFCQAYQTQQNGTRQVRRGAQPAGASGAPRGQSDAW